MSCQRGNEKRERSQKHKNQSGFRNNLHDNSQKQKLINTLTFNDTCDRCSQILQWKVQYKKYKPLTHPKKCSRCQMPTVKLAYRIMCPGCAEKENICPKCCKPMGLDFTPNVVTVQTVADLGPELLKKLRALPERRRRRFERMILKGKTPSEAINVAGGSEYSGVPQTNYWTQEELVLQLDALSIQFNKDDLDDLYFKSSDDEDDLD